MSIIANHKKIRKEMLRQYHEHCVSQAIVERDAMDEMLEVLRDSDTPMTAAQIEAACTSGISRYEIAGNLQAMKTHHSRYENRDTIFTREIKPVNVPVGNGKERIIVKGGGSRKVTVVEVDEYERIIPNTKRTMYIKEAKKYFIEGH